ncbi:MAG: hypothetical protein H6706_18860 [Myxococcales bacterium]|nr:hypothetical protein [Myxococcales bacterium]
MTSPRGEVLDLGPLLAAVWQAADGDRSVAALHEAVQAVDAAADVSIVWQALDALADADLLTGRIAPPGGVFDPRLVIRRPIHTPRTPPRPRHEDHALQVQRERLGRQRHAEEQRKERNRAEAARLGPQAMRRERSGKVAERQQLARQEAALFQEARSRS